MIHFFIQTRDALEAAEEIVTVERWRDMPILAFIPVSDWEQIKNKDAVDSLTGAETTLDSFRDKTVVFCHYGEGEEELLSKLSRDWARHLDGVSVMVELV